MSLREDSTKIAADVKSDGASSDICVVDNSNDTSQESNGWRHSSPVNNAKLINSHKSNNSDSSVALLTPSPPYKAKPVSSLKRKILAPYPPNSPKRPNKDLKTAIEKLRPIKKYFFVKPNGESPNFIFAKEKIKFTAHSSTTPAGKETSRVRSPMPSIKNQQRHQKLPATTRQKEISPSIQSNKATCQQILPCPEQQITPRTPSPQQLDVKVSNSSNAHKQNTPIASPLLPTKPHILEHIIIKQPNEISRQSVSNTKNQQKQQQHVQQLQQQRQQIQQQLQQVDQQLQQEEHAQQGHLPCELLLSPKRNTQTLQRYTEPQINSSSTSKAVNQLHSDTPPITPSTTHPQQKPKHNFQINQHLNSYQKPPSAGAHSPPQESPSLPWATQMEKQQSCLQQDNNPNMHLHSPATHKRSEHSQQYLQPQLDQQAPLARPQSDSSPNKPQKLRRQHAFPQATPKHPQHIPSPQPAQSDNSKKIPSIFIPKIASIDQLLLKINVLLIPSYSPQPVIKKEESESSAMILPLTQTFSIC